jgi:hypothetical protein
MLVGGVVEAVLTQHLQSDYAQGSEEDGRILGLMQRRKQGGCVTRWVKLIDGGDGTCSRPQGTRFSTLRPQLSAGV